VLPLVVLVVADRLWTWTSWVKKKKKVSNNDINQQLKKVTQQ
jgi:hypothetical protein